MAKKIFKPRSHETGTVITTKTAYGSTSDMVVDVSNYQESLNLSENEVVCKDDRGFYITLKNRIDSKIADPNRYANQKARVTLTEKTQAT
jgi:hypothetical protein